MKSLLLLSELSWRIDAFKLCWRGLVKIPWTMRRTNQSILKEINPECSLERLMLKLQYFGHLMQRASPLEKTLMLGKTEGRRSGWQIMKWLNGITDSMDLSVSKLPRYGEGQRSLKCYSPWGSRELDTT